MWFHGREECSPLHKKANLNKKAIYENMSKTKYLCSLIEYGYSFFYQIFIDDLEKLYKSSVLESFLISLQSISYELPSRTVYMMLPTFELKYAQFLRIFNIIKKIVSFALIMLFC